MPEEKNGTSTSGRTPPRFIPSTGSLWSYAYGGTQLAVSVLLGFGAGFLGDRYWRIFPWLTLSGSALGLAAGLYHFIKPFLDRADNQK